MATQALEASKSMSKEKLAQKWANLKGRLSRAAKQGEEIARRAMVGVTTVGAFAAAYYWRRRRQLAGKGVTFDKKGKVDAFFWPGLVVAAFGVTPFSGEAGPYVTALGSGVACAGTVDYIDQMAKDHHAKK